MFLSTPTHPSLSLRTLAGLLGATAIRAPAPPFPATSWFVCSGGNHGLLIEVMPWGAIRDPAMASTLGHDAAMRPSSGSHILVGTSQTETTVLDLAANAGWRTERCSAGLFQLVKVWVENAFLVEIMTMEKARVYQAVFGAGGLQTLDKNCERLNAH